MCTCVSGNQKPSPSYGGEYYTDNLVPISQTQAQSPAKRGIAQQDEYTLSGCEN